MFSQISEPKKSELLELLSKVSRIIIKIETKTSSDPNSSKKDFDLIIKVPDISNDNRKELQHSLETLYNSQSLNTYALSDYVSTLAKIGAEANVEEDELSIASGNFTVEQSLSSNVPIP